MEQEESMSMSLLSSYDEEAIQALYPVSKKRNENEELSSLSVKRQRVIRNLNQESDYNTSNSIDETLETEYVPRPAPTRVRYRQVLRHVPTIPYVPISCSDGSRVYLRLLSKNNEIEEKSTKTPQPLGSLLGVDFYELKRQARELKDKFHVALAVVVDKENIVPVGATEDLWVEKYRPKSYFDLLSEEAVNRHLLHWLKLWDKSVFGTDYLAKVKVTKEKYSELEEKEKEKSKWSKVVMEDDSYDDTGRPKHKIALLYGNPGLGKTTCSHIVAIHAGYNVREMNASDDRSVEIFKKTLDSATQSQSEMFQDGRPNCLVIDEIDGAPTSTVNILIDLITDKAVESGKKKAKKILRRPIICICNDLYAPSLKNLRQHAYVLQFHPIPVANMVDRVAEISLKEKLNLDNGLMQSLCYKSECDIRSCLATLQFIKSKGGSAKEALFSQIGTKDKSKGIFAVWSDIFTLPEGKKYFDMADPSKPDARFNNILKLAQNFGDYEKLQSGVFENYLKTKSRDSYFQSILEGLSWNNWFEDIRNQVERTQNYTMYGYLPVFFVTTHFLFATRNWFQIQYPNSDIYFKSQRFSNIIKSEVKDMCPTVGKHLNSSGLVLDILPSVLNIIQPNTIRPVPTQIWSDKERETLKNVVEIMLAYNLSYIQQRSAEGSYEFVMEPNIEELCRFPTEDSTKRHNFAYTIKQLVAREIETEKLRRNDTMAAGEVWAKPVVKKGTPSTPSTPVTPKINETVVAKDFFGRPIIPSPESVKEDEEKKKRGAKVFFRFKEGYSNAVRKYVKMKDLL